MLRAHPAGFPRVDATAFVDDSAQVIGDVEIGQESSVWMNVVCRMVIIARVRTVQEHHMVMLMKITDYLLGMDGALFENSYILLMLIL